MKKEIVIEVLATVFFSFIVGSLVPLPYVMTQIDQNRMIHLLWSGLVGVGIGLACRILFTFIFKSLMSRPCWAFLGVFLVIGTTTFPASLLLGIQEMRFLILILILSEAAGMVLCLLLYRYGQRLNRKLRETQEKLSS